MISLEKLIADPWLHVEGQLALPSRKTRVGLSLRFGGERTQDCLDGAPQAGGFVWSHSKRATKAYQDPRCRGWLSW